MTEDRLSDLLKDLKEEAIKANKSMLVIEYDPKLVQKTPEWYHVAKVYFRVHNDRVYSDFRIKFTNKQRDPMDLDYVLIPIATLLVSSDFQSYSLMTDIFSDSDEILDLDVSLTFTTYYVTARLKSVLDKYFDGKGELVW